MRVDIPTLQCDRCKGQTQDLDEMARFNTISNSHQSGTDSWDLCPQCWTVFFKFLHPEAALAGLSIDQFAGNVRDQLDHDREG